MAPDPWLSMYDSTCHIAQEIAKKIQERNRCQRNGESSTKLNVTIRSLLQNLKEKIDQLKDLLLRAISTCQITQLEGDRRQNLVDDLLTRQRQLQASYKNDGTEPDVIRGVIQEAPPEEEVGEVDLCSRDIHLNRDEQSSAFRLALFNIFRGIVQEALPEETVEEVQTGRPSNQR